jgi:hypothetical protein
MIEQSTYTIGKKTYPITIITNEPSREAIEAFNKEYAKLIKQKMLQNYIDEHDTI